MDPPKLSLQEENKEELDDNQVTIGLDSERRGSLAIPFGSHRGSIGSNLIGGPHRGSIGSNLMGGPLASSISQHSALSTAVLDEHERSMVSLIGRKTDKVVRIASWLSDVSKKESVTSDLPEEERDELERNLPLDYQASETIAGSDLRSSSSQARSDYIHNMLTTDDDGNKMVITPSNKGRYQPQDSNDTALHKIGFNELSRINDHESTADQSASDMSLSTLRSPKQFAASKMQRANYLSKVSKITGQRSSVVPVLEDEASTVLTGNSDTDMRSEVTGYTAFTEKSAKEEQQPESRITSARGIVGLMTGLKKWKGMDTKTGRFGGMKSFAKDEGHYKFIQNNMHKVAVEMPMPLRKVMVEEVHGILKDTAKGYAKELGNDDPLTAVVNEKLEEIELLARQFDSL